RRRQRALGSGVGLGLGRELGGGFGVGDGFGLGRGARAGTRRGARTRPRRSAEEHAHSSWQLTWVSRGSCRSLWHLKEANMLKTRPRGDAGSAMGGLASLSSGSG